MVVSQAVPNADVEEEGKDVDLYADKLRKHVQVGYTATSSVIKKHNALPHLVRVPMTTDVTYRAHSRPVRQRTKSPGSSAYGGTYDLTGA